MSISPETGGAGSARLVAGSVGRASADLILGDCKAADLAAEFGTPLVVIDEAALRTAMRRFRAAFTKPGRLALVTYAGKALLVRAIAAIAHEEGLIVDVCSLGELQTALSAGVPANRCIVHGCFKLPEEIEQAASIGVRHVVVDNVDEIAALDAAAARHQMTCGVLVRVNPGIEAMTHDHVQTGAARSKFGFPIDDGQALAALELVHAAPHLALDGLHCHLGSQIVDLTAYEREIAALAVLARRAPPALRERIRYVNVGGGLGIDEGDRLGPSPEAWADALFGAFDRHWGARVAVAGPAVHVMVEPGRAIVGPAATTLYRVGVRKRLADGTDALIVDGGLSDNPRPALYGANYRASLAHKHGVRPTGTFAVYGRHCETDRMVANAPLPDPQAGDLLALHASGAYTYAMASNYNRFQRPAVVLVSEGRARLIARREPLEHVLDLDVS